MIYLFALASKQGVLRPEEAIESPLPSPPSLPAGARCPERSRQGFAAPAGGQRQATVDGLKTIHMAGPRPRGLGSITPAVRETGPDSGEESPAVQTHRCRIPTRASRGCLLNSPRKIPDAHACRGKVSCSPGGRAAIKTSPALQAARAAGLGPAARSETPPTAFWCRSKSLCFFSQLFAVGLQGMI